MLIKLLLVILSSEIAAFKAPDEQEDTEIYKKSLKRKLSPFILKLTQDVKKSYKENLKHGNSFLTEEVNDIKNHFKKLSMENKDHIKDTAFPLNIKKRKTSRKYKVDVKNDKRQLDEGNIYDILNKVLEEPNLQLNPITHQNAESFHKYIEDTSTMKNVNEGENSDFLCDMENTKLAEGKELSYWNSNNCKPTLAIENNYGIGMGNNLNILWESKNDLANQNKILVNGVNPCKFRETSYLDRKNTEPSEHLDTIIVNNKQEPCEKRENFIKTSAPEINKMMYENEYNKQRMPITYRTSETGSENIGFINSRINKITENIDFERLTSPAYNEISKSGKTNEKVDTENNNLNMKTKESEGSAFDQVGVRAHNVFRKIHGVADLQLDAQMSESAQKYAVYLAGIQTLKHAELADEGENLAYACRSDGREMTAAEAVKDWYSEVCKRGYTFGSEGTSGTGHFTQVVWKGSTFVGMGMAVSNKGGMLCTYVVARYKPAGNVASQYKENVLAGSFASESPCSKLDSLMISAALGGALNGASGAAGGDSEAGAANVENGAAFSNSKTSPGESEGSAFDQVGVRAHNVFRKIHGVADLQLDAQMSESAQKYAVYLAGIQTLKHAELADEGENLAYACRSDGREMTAAEAVKDWYSEVCKRGYTFGSEGFSGTGHFTQVVWRGSKYFGIGKASFVKDGSLCTIFVARYKPKGNVADAFAENVLQGSFSFSESCNNLVSEDFGAKVVNIPVLFSNEGDKSLFEGTFRLNHALSLLFEKGALHAAMTEALKGHARTSDDDHKKYLVNVKNFSSVLSNGAVASSSRSVRKHKLHADDMLHRVKSFLQSKFKRRKTGKKIRKRTRILFHY